MNRVKGRQLQANMNRIKALKAHAHNAQVEMRRKGRDCSSNQQIDSILMIPDTATGEKKRAHVTDRHGVAELARRVMESASSILLLTIIIPPPS